MKLSIIIPAYNEEKILEKVLDEVKDLVAREGYEAEIIVVDDGSCDKTSEAARKKVANVLRHEKNRGYGAAIKTGIAASKYDNILILDGDGSYPVTEIPSLLKDVDKYDMVVGSRTKKGAKIPFLRRIPKYILAKLSEYLTVEKIPDINSGLRVFKKSMYNKYAGLLPSGFSFTLTITLAAISNNEKVKFIPVSYHKRKGISKIRPVYDTSNFLLLIIRTILYFNPIRVLLPLSAIFIFIAAVISFYSIFVIGRFLDVTVTVLLMFAIQLIILALIADLINRKIR